MSTLIATSGTAELRVAPDRATVHVAIRTTDTDSLRAAARVNAPVERDVMAALESAGVPRSQVATVGYDTGRERVYKNKKWVEGDYYVDHVLSVEVLDIERVGAVIAAARNAGATRVAGVRFWLSMEEETREQATRRAVTQAFARARTLAESAGATLGRVVRLGTPEALAAALGSGGPAGRFYNMEVAEAAGPRDVDVSDLEREPLILPVPITVSVVVFGAWEIALAGEEVARPRET